MTPFEIGDKVLVLVGVFLGKQGKVRAIGKDDPAAPKCIGVSIVGSGSSLVWFKPEEIKLIEEG